MHSINRLSTLAIKALKSPGRYADGGGLYLQIKNGGRSWVFIYRDRATSKLRNLGFGPLHAVPLGEARKRAGLTRQLLASGADPLAARKAARAALAKSRTFGDFCAEFLESALAGFKNVKHKAQWKSSLETYAKPLWPLTLQAVDTGHLRKVLDPIWNKKRETASRVRQRIERVLDAAKAAGLRDGDNPARWRGHLQTFYGTTKKIVRHHKAVPYAEMPHFMGQLRSRESASAAALEFTILTAARSGETTGARWREIDFKERLWIVPPERMKAKRIHRVPLNDAAIALLKKRKPGKAGDLIFANDGQQLSDMALLECVRNLRTDGATVHGFRSSFRDWCGDETNFPREVCEAALAHTLEDDTEAAYRRSDALKKRRALMEAWTGYLAGERGKIIPMHSAKQ